MDIKYIRRFHELLYCAVVGGMVSATLYLITGNAPGALGVMINGWTTVNLLALISEKRRIKQVKKLKTLHEQPAREQDARNNSKKK